MKLKLIDRNLISNITWEVIDKMKSKILITAITTTLLIPLTNISTKAISNVTSLQTNLAMNQIKGVYYLVR